LSLGVGVEEVLPVEQEAVLEDYYRLQVMPSLLVLLLP
jgi:hypothetical protein